MEAEESRALPGYREPATVRTFDAPEALDTRFYEVRSKSALNRVPKASRMPFRWTVNPYRGCSHACVYCLGPDTPISLADGGTRALADLRPGDAIYGTRREGRDRRYTRTEVLAHWSARKPAFRVTLSDGTELLASGDHRFLTRRGWKHVTDGQGAPGQRPHLTGNDELLGLGAPGVAPDDSPEYRRGYLAGVVRGDGTLGTYASDRPDRGPSEVHRFRLAMTEAEALERARTYLAALGIGTQRFTFSPATERRRAVEAIRTSTRDGVAAIRSLIAWPGTARIEWSRGFLAGIFDAEGSHSESLRIHNTDPAILGWTEATMRRLGFAVRVEDRGLANGLASVRLLGGMRESQRFMQVVDPAISRKRSIEGRALKSPTSLRVASIEPLRGDHLLYDITTGTGDFIANGVVSHNCFARPTHTYLDLGAGRDFEKEIVVKVNVPEVLRSELARPGWKREHVAMGTNTDPYQWVEGRYRLMPDIWRALADHRTPASVLSKSPLLLRDLELMKRVPDISANLSIPTFEEKAWRATEPHTPHPRARMEAVAELNRQGIPTGVLVAPLMPGINDSPRQVERILELAEEAGAVSVGGIALHLRGEVRGIFFDWLRSQRPDLVERYDQLYARGAYAPRAERERIARLTHGHGRRFLLPAPTDRTETPTPPPPAQVSLF